ncbi:hypothetical protein BJ165DRAFT_1407697 [Panaeolus papilionaceus]|nr:hypothetical protein BJ165DRAFT_1407697 [Panaeolus papilionaceus]
MASFPSPHLSEKDFYYPVGVCIEGIMYGFYTALFLTALWIWRTRWPNLRSSTFSARLYLIVITLMWIVATVHLGIIIRRLLRIFILEVSNPKPTAVRLLDATRWDTVAHMVLVSAMVWLGDILVLYRTYVVWHKNIWVIVVPLILHVTYLVINTMATYWLSHPNLISGEVAYTWYRPVFPILFAQNLLTTSLLAYKVWSQHRASVANGVMHAGHALSLGYVARMLIETVMLYTIELLVIIVLGSIKHPATGSVVICLVPTVGIVFVLLSIRVHFGVTNQPDTGQASRMPQWLHDSVSRDDDIELSRPASAASHGGIDLGLRSRRDKLVLQPLDPEDAEPFPTISFSQK